MSISPPFSQMLAARCRELIEQRCQQPSVGRWDVRSRLAHFALITYALPRERLLPHVPGDRFQIAEFEVNGRRLALMSAVVFLDLDFHFPRLFPSAKFCFAQTNYRIYVNDARTGEPCVWFFGTTLGSATVVIPRLLWRLPWHSARYEMNCEHDATSRRYRKFHVVTKSSWAPATVELEDSGSPAVTCPGFANEEETALVLTHPVDGYFRRNDGAVGHYSVWHKRMVMTTGQPVRLWFGLFERLGLLSLEEMRSPHSVLLQPEIEFLIHLPPRRLN
jgi:hypothetical protein